MKMRNAEVSAMLSQHHKGQPGSVYDRSAKSPRFQPCLCRLRKYYREKSCLSLLPDAFRRSAVPMWYRGIRHLTVVVVPRIECLPPCAPDYSLMEA